MQWLSSTPNFNFMKYRRAALIGSSVVTVIAILSIAFRGLNLGIDFTGGVLLEARYPAEADLTAIRADLESAGFEGAQVQTFGSTSEVLIRLPPLGDVTDAQGTQAQMLEILRAREPNVDLDPVVAVGGQVGADLAESAAMALLMALLMIFIYVALRFRWKLAVGSIVATIHDVVVTVGVFSLLQWPFDLTVLGSVLAVLGYSLNDTIVVYDRIRDNFRLMRRGTPQEIVNASVNQTLARTLVTGVTSLLVLVALMWLGGDTLRWFAVALIIGIVVGTYSSIYVASAMALALGVTPADVVPAKRAEVDELP
jgi:preprotein translocase subunit SecF